MNENALLIFLKNISLVCNWIGLLTALAFLFGPKLLLVVSNILDKPRRTMNLEKVLVTKARIILGLALLIITVLMLSLVMNIKV